MECKYSYSVELKHANKIFRDTVRIFKFQNNKIYNCDLSASYNIGARFFIREYQKSISVKKWSRVVAKVPDLVKRTLCTYKTYLDILSLNTSC